MHRVDPVLTEKYNLPADPKALASALFSELAGRFEREGGYPEIGNFMTGWDPHFGFRDWLKVFRTVPSLRKYLVPALLWNLLFSRRPLHGFAERIIPGRKYNFPYRSFCTDLLILETVGQAARHFGFEVPGGCKAAVADTISLAWDNGYTVEPDGRPLAMLSYYPRKDHRVPKDNPVHGMFFSRDDNVPDNDTSCIIFASMLACIESFGLDPALYRHGREDTGRFVASLAEHVYGEGRYGRGSLNYDNGARPEDCGVLTWVFDAHNELDPTSNIDILHYLALVDRIFPDAAPQLPALTNKILRFLGNHVRSGDFLDQRFQTYYPLGSTYNLWRRFKVHFDTLPEARRGELDRDSVVHRVDDHLAERGQEIFKPGDSGYNPYDFLLAAPFLHSHGLMEKRITDWVLTEAGGLAHFRENHYEFFHLRYPSKIIGAPVLLPNAVILELCMLIDKAGS